MAYTTSVVRGDGSEPKPGTNSISTGANFVPLRKKTASIQLIFNPTSIELIFEKFYLAVSFRAPQPSHRENFSKGTYPLDLPSKPSVELIFEKF